MIDTSKQYTYNGKPVRIYADGSDTYSNYIHAAYFDCDGWNTVILKEESLVEVWEPKDKQLCWCWNYGYVYPDVRHYCAKDGKVYDFYSEFKGKLPEAFKGLQ